MVKNLSLLRKSLLIQCLTNMYTAMKILFNFKLQTKDLCWILNCSYNYHYAWEHGTVYGFMAQYITQWNIIIIYLHLLSCSSICHSWILSSCVCFQRTEILWSRCSLCLNTVQLMVWCVAHWAAAHSHTLRLQTLARSAPAAVYRCIIYRQHYKHICCVMNYYTVYHAMYTRRPLSSENIGKKNLQYWHRAWSFLRHRAFVHFWNSKQAAFYACVWKCGIFPEH